MEPARDYTIKMGPRTLAALITIVFMVGVLLGHFSQGPL